MFFDTHAHYDDPQFDTDRETFLAELPAKGVSLVVDPGQDLATNRTAVRLAETFPHVYAAVGWHPHNASEYAGDSPEQLRAWAENPRIVAIGEIGLDYHYDFSPRDKQQAVFREQLALAGELKLPAIVHEREACADTLSIIRDCPDAHGVVHCFSGSWETARELLDRGWWLSFTGVITFKNARKALEVIEKMPLDRLMIETDSPYLAPVPMRGQRNSSLNLPYIAEIIARLRGMTTEEVAALTLKNGRSFFGI